MFQDNSLRPRFERGLYPPLEPRAVLRLAVGGGHVLHVEDCGDAEGIAALFLHGGPGSSCKEYHRRFFDPRRWRPVLFDQRGCGRSTPRGELAGNDTHALLRDMEAIRIALGIERWVLFGGSWGSTLALLYAELHPERVLGIILRGSFLARPRDVEWFFGDGARRLYPEAWARLESALELRPGQDLIEACHRRILGDDAEQRLSAARAWAQWSSAIVAFALPGGDAGAAGDPAHLLADVGIEVHYAHHGYFIGPDQILADIGRVPRVPVTLVHGRRDLTCPLESSHLLHQALPGSRLEVLHEAGHLASEPPTVDALVRATDAMADAIRPA
ncbi:MAG: prolyl aminopeptidase [Gammaproteobacteria bacterium]